ncbi:MAG: hypothetical protein ACE3JP_06740 [Ectobacillus sp.]
MLHARIIYKNENPQTEIETLLTPTAEKLITTEVNEDIREIMVSFSEKLSYPQYDVVHRFLVALSERVNGRIYDKGALLGYLKDGTPAYIVTNWDEWSRFLHGEKLKASQGEYVHVYAGGELLDSGILLEYEVTGEGETFAIISCTLITSEGEQTFYGDSLTLEAEQRF